VSVRQKLVNRSENEKNKKIEADSGMQDDERREWKWSAAGVEMR